MAVNEEYEFDPTKLYDEFPTDKGFGPDEGYNTWVRINDERLFTDEAKADPAIRAFLDAPFSVSFSQWKSSQRASEYFIHMPLETMRGNVEGIKGEVDLPGDPSLSTLVMNHEHTLAKWVTRSLLVTDDTDCGQIVHKQQEPAEG